MDNFVNLRNDIDSQRNYAKNEEMINVLSFYFGDNDFWFFEKGFRYVNLKYFISNIHN